MPRKSKKKEGYPLVINGDILFLEKDHAICRLIKKDSVFAIFIDERGIINLRLDEETSETKEKKRKKK